MIPNVFLLGRLRRPKRIAKKRILRAFEIQAKAIHAEKRRWTQLVERLREHMAPLPDDRRVMRIPFVQNKEKE